jgi:hypothetical protein
MSIESWKPPADMSPVQQASIMYHSQQSKTRRARRILVSEVKKASAAEVPVAQLAVEAGVTRETIYQWLQEEEKNDDDA